MLGELLDVSDEGVAVADELALDLVGRIPSTRELNKPPPAVEGCYRNISLAI